MLVKSYSSKFMDDMGLVSPDKKYVHFLDGTTVDNSPRLSLSPVVRVNARWMYKDIKIKCKVADTISKKRLGLQGCSVLASNEGMYFPYEDYTDVTFHQGRVPYSLDLIFLRDFEVIQTEQNTRIGSSDKWGCCNCDGVIEVNGGFCKAYNIQETDKILINAVSKRDIAELEEERINDALLNVV